MRRTIALFLTVIGIALPWSGAHLAGQSQPPSVARIEGRPNLSGIWQAMNEANWDIQAHEARPGPPQFGALLAEPAGRGVVEGNEIPYQPWALEKKTQNFANRWTEDPEAKCFMPGIPRATYMPFPFQIIQGTDTILIVYPFASASRLIYMDDVGESPSDTWMGWSRGTWDGDALVVDVASVVDQTWFDRAGQFSQQRTARHRALQTREPQSDSVRGDDRGSESLHAPVDDQHAAVPGQERNAQLLEFKCVPFAQELVYGHLRRK